MPRDQTDSWFVASSDFCTKIVSGFFLELVSCIRFRVEEPPDDRGPGQNARFTNIYSAHSLVLSVENRDSMALLAAIFTGRESKARELLALPWTNINAQYANGNTPLILAVQGNNLSLVQLLLEHPKINVNLRGLDGYTALIRACGHERIEYVRMLLNHPNTNVNLATYYGSTALTFAIRCGNDEAAHLLLRRWDIDVNAQGCDGRRVCTGSGNFGENALIEAVVYRRHSIARTLACRRDIVLDVVDERDRTPLIMATQYGYSSLVRLLIRNGADPCAEDDHSNNALYYAVKRGSVEMIEDLLRALYRQPQPLTRLCRTVIRRYLRNNLGYGGESLKFVFEKIPHYEVPRAVKRFLAFEA